MNNHNYAHIFPHRTPFKPSLISIACAVHCAYWKELYGTKEPGRKQEQSAGNNPQSSSIPIPAS